jgi:hypothetical protein
MNNIPDYPRINVTIERDPRSFNHILIASGKSPDGRDVVVTRTVSELGLAASYAGYYAEPQRSGLDIEREKLIQEFYERRNEMSSGSGGAGGSAGYYSSGSYFGDGTSSSYNGSYIGSYYPSPYDQYHSHTHTITTASGCMPVVTHGGEKIIEKENRKDLFKLKNMPEWRKQRMHDILHKFIKEYKYKEGVDNMTKGLKWFLFFLGFAITWNFSRILDIIAAVVGAK